MCRNRYLDDSFGREKAHQEVVMGRWPWRMDQISRDVGGETTKQRPVSWGGTGLRARARVGSMQSGGGSTGSPKDVRVEDTAGTVLWE